MGRRRKSKEQILDFGSSEPIRFLGFARQSKKCSTVLSAAVMRRTQFCSESRLRRKACVPCRSTKEGDDSLGGSFFVAVIFGRRIVDDNILLHLQWRLQ
jgi:hypothetical protein